MNTKQNKGVARQAFIDSGKPIVLWRGRPVRMKDRKKEASKKACRGKNGERYEDIREGERVRKGVMS